MPDVFDEVTSDALEKQPKDVFTEGAKDMMQDVQDVTKTPATAKPLREATVLENLRMSTVGKKAAEVLGGVQTAVDTVFKMASIPEKLRPFVRNVAENIPGFGEGTKAAREFGPAPVRGAVAGAENVALGLPWGLAALPGVAPLTRGAFGALGATRAEAGVNAGINALFAGQVAISAPEMWREFQKARSEGRSEEAYQIATEAVLNGLLVGMGVAHSVTGLKAFGKEKPYARSVEEAAEIYGGVRSQSQQGTVKVPTKGRSERVLTPTEPLAQKAQVSLDPKIAELDKQEADLNEMIAQIHRTHGPKEKPDMSGTMFKIGRGGEVPMVSQRDWIPGEQELHQKLGEVREARARLKEDETSAISREIKSLTTQLEAIDKQHGPLTEVDPSGKDVMLRPMVKGEQEIWQRLDALIKQKEAAGKKPPPVPQQAKMPADQPKPPPPIPGEKPLLSRFDAETPTEEAMKSLMATYPDMDPVQAWDLLKRSRLSHGLPERLPGEPGGPAAPAPEAKQGEMDLKTKQGLPPGIVKEDNGMFSFNWRDKGYNRKASFKTLEEAVAHSEVIAKAQKESATKRSVTKEDPLAKHAQKKADQAGTQLSFTDDNLDPNNAPFAGSNIATGRNGQITINRKAFYDWLSRMPSERREAAIERLINEEHIHALVPDWMAKAYWRSLTWLEKKAITKRYEGTWSTDEPEVNMGHEALRGRIQEMSGKGTREYVESGLQEKMVVGTAQTLEKVVGWLRKAWGTKGSRTGADILERAQKNVTELTKALGGQADEEVSPKAKDRARMVTDRAEYDRLQEPFRKSIQDYMNAFKAGDEAGIAKAENDRIAIQKQIEEIKNRNGGMPPPAMEPEAAPAAKRRKSFKDQDDNVLRARSSQIESQLDKIWPEWKELYTTDALQEQPDRVQDLVSEMDEIMLELEGRGGPEFLESEPSSGAPDYITRRRIIKPGGEGGPYEIGPGTGPSAKRRYAKGQEPRWKRPNLINLDTQGSNFPMEIYHKMEQKFGPMIGWAETFRLAYEDPKNWPLRSSEKADLIKWFNSQEGKGFSRTEFLGDAAESSMRYADDYQRDLNNLDLLSESFSKGQDNLLLNWLASRNFKTVYEARSVIESGRDMYRDEEVRLRDLLQDLTGQKFVNFDREPPTYPTEFTQPPQDQPDLPFGPFSKQRKRKEDSRQTFMFFQDPAQEEFLFSRHPTAELSGAPQKKDYEDLARSMLNKSIHPSQITEKGVSWIRPNFQQFLKSVRREMETKHIQPEQVRKIWEDAVWEHLSKADPVRLDLWRRSLNLEDKLGKREIAGVMKEESRDEKLNLVKMDLMEVAKRREKEATKIEGQAKALKERISQLQVIQPMERRRILDQIDSLESRARQMSQQADALEQVEEGEVITEEARDQARDLRSQASALMSEARTLKARMSGTVGPMERVDIQGQLAALEGKARQKRQEADDIMRSIREDSVQLPPQEALPEPEKPLPDLPGVSPETKTAARETEAAKLRRQAKALDEYLNNLHTEMVLATGDEAKVTKLRAQIEQVLNKSEAYKARADIVEAGGNIDPYQPVKGRTSQQMAGMSAQRYRSVVMSSIANRLILESLPATNLRREEITLDDIDFDANVEEDPYFAVTERDLRKPEAIRSVFKSGARRSNKDPVTVTKRLAVLEDKQNGQVYIVSAYLDGHKGVRVLRPVPGVEMARDPKTGEIFSKNEIPAGRETEPYYRPTELEMESEHVPMRDLMDRYRLHYSILLKDPVQFFQHQFSNIRDYNRAIGNDAREIAANRRYAAFVGEAKAIEDDILPPEEQPAIDITKQIPPRGMLTKTFNIGSGVTEASRRKPISATEAASIVDWLNDTVGEVNTKQDLLDALDFLAHRAKELTEGAKEATKRIGRKENVLTPEALKARTFWQPLMGQHRLVISALTKIANSFFRRDPRVEEMSDFEIERESLKWMNQALDAVYENIKASQYPLKIEGGPSTGIDADRFVQRLLDRFVPPNSETVSKQLAYKNWSEQGRQAFIGEGFEPGPEPSRTATELGGGVYGREMYRGKVPIPTQARYGRVAPTVTRPDQLPPGTPIAERQPAPQQPEATPGAFTPPPKLTAENAAFVEAKAAESIKYQQTPSPEPEPDFIGPREQEPPVFSFRPEGYPQPETWGPYARGRKRSALLGAWDRLNQAITAKFARSGTEDIIAAWADSARNKAAIFGQQSEDRVSSFSKPEDKMLRAAAKAMIASNGEPVKLQGFLKLIDQGELAADLEIAKNDPETRRAARAWKDAAIELRKEVEFALSNPTNPDLLATVDAAREELKAAYDFETKNGIDLTWEPDYVPGRYEGEVFSDNSVTFFDSKILGKNFRKPKIFPNYYEAIANGPYIPKNYDIAKLVGHRVRQGMTSILPEMYLKSLRNLDDPNSGEPVAMDPARQMIYHPPNPTFGIPGRWLPGKYIAPSPFYKPLVLGVNRTPIYIREGYYDLVKLLTLKEGGVSASPVGRQFLIATGFLKHGVTLILDSFHPIRLAQYSLAANGFGVDPLGRGGWKALEYRDADIPRAVANGWISKADADWALQTQTVTMPGGRKANLTHRQLLDVALEHGLNVGRIQDALYQDWLSIYDFVIPWKDARGNNVMKKFNREVFDKMTRGLMAESAVKAFVEANKKTPDAKLGDLMRDVVRDVNLYYGSIGRQGWFKNPTWQEASQLAFLAPQWVEGLLQKEVRAAFRAGATATGLHGYTQRGQMKLPPMGYLGKGVGRGLVAYMALTQALNMLTRGKPTWENEEKEHMWDAWIPYSNGGGFWLSPMSVFAEVMHDVIRINYTKPKTFDTFRQIGENKMNTWGRALMVLLTGKNAMGERATTSWGEVKDVLEAVTPTPITLGKLGREALSATGLVAKNPPGTIPRQAAASILGMKIEPSKSPSQQMMNKGRQWMQQNGLEFRPYDLTPTDEPSYDKMRNALRADDWASANSILKELRKHKTDDQIMHAMKVWVNTPFTQNKMMEKMFIGSLDNNGLNLYTAAVEERYQMLAKFYEYYLTKAPEP